MHMNAGRWVLALAFVLGGCGVVEEDDPGIGSETGLPLLAGSEDEPELLTDLPRITPFRLASPSGSGGGASGGGASGGGTSGGSSGGAGGGGPSSRWARWDSGGSLDYAHDGEGDRVPDFSFAGYRGGGVALPRVSAVVHLSPSQGDDTRRIQAALDAVGRRPLDARGGLLQQLTRDHTLVDERLRNHVITHEQASGHAMRHVVTNALGGDSPGVHVEVQRTRLEVGDVLLLCSDGLTGMVPDDQICAVLAAEADPRRACERLLAAALEAGGTDNVTLIVARFDAPAAGR
jgi:hypothetical protein